MTLERDDVQQVVGRVLDVHALDRGAAIGNPKQPEQAHHVIKAQPARVSKHGPDGLNEWLVLGGLQSLRNPGRKAPILPLRVVKIRGRADRHAVCQQLGPLIRGMSHIPADTDEKLPEKSTRLGSILVRGATAIGAASVIFDFSTEMT